MAEIALRTTEFRSQKLKYLAYRPKGSVIDGVSDYVIRWKWCDIICNLVAPSHRAQFTAIPGYDILIAAWTPTLLGKWVEFKRGHKLGQPKFTTELTQFWTTDIEPEGFLGSLPKDPTKKKPIYDTFLWSSRDRKDSFVVVSTLTDAEIVDLKRFDLHAATVDGSPADVVGPRKMLDYETNLGLNPKKLSDIADPDVEVHPDFDHPVAKNMFEDVPTIIVTP